MVFDLLPAHRAPAHRAGSRRPPVVVGTAAARSAPVRSATVSSATVGSAPARSATVGLAAVRKAAVGSAADVLALQRTAGNRAVSGVLTAQRFAPGVAVGPVHVNHQLISVPIPAASTLQAGVPAGQRVDWSLEAGTAAIGSGTAIDTTGRVTLGADQQGGTITIKAADSTTPAATASIDVALIAAPESIASTAETGSARADEYGAAFQHTFAAPGGRSGAECEGGRVNEIFPRLPNPNGTQHRIETPFGPFTLETNNPRDVDGGWGIDASGTMTGDDNVAIGRRGLSIRPFIANASNPTPTQALPAEFTVSQDLRSVEVPTDRFRTAFATVDHKRELREDSPGAPQFVVTVNGVEHRDDYTGDAAVRNAQADAATVAVSAPGATNTVTISAESTPTGAPITFRIVGRALGCTIDPATGQLTIGTRPGTVRVRASIGRRHFDEVTVTITP
ncbi:hypothetical protein [Saccharothrix variisporea]|uniref:Uncharacterized protein n=1 Tax=Saccharothrix variisporea TaxID=543527 RepID=A0A495WYS5_9PSEU|nr:hypothetical protein [Saccharothrix variisporea]RKT66872.1 hypothetical protein DFJ66_0036 [Saccharothrix variisporea]